MPPAVNVELFVFDSKLLFYKNVLLFDNVYCFVFYFLFADVKNDFILISHFNVYMYYYVDFFIGGKYPMNFT